MLKKILFAVVLCLGVVGVSVGYRKISYDLPKQRFLAINKPSHGQDKFVMVMFQNMIFPAGKSVTGVDPTITDAGFCSDPELSGYFNHLRNRVDWIRALGDNFMSAKVTKMTVQSKGERIRAQDFEMFGVMAVEIVDSQGRKKLWATDVMQIGSMNSGTPDKPIAYPKQQIARREDFANPEDVDWLLGVPDFSTYGMIKTEVR